MKTLRKAADRGAAEHGWLSSRHSFSFADYYDPEFMGFSDLRVINEDRVTAGAGFGTHSHRDMEILSYVLEGALEHRDTLGTGSVIQPGDVQLMSAGRGISHSEFNHSKTEGVHFLQIWIQPGKRGIPARYQEMRVPSSDKRGTARLILSPDGRDGTLQIHQDTYVYAGLFDGAERTVVEVAPGRAVYVHLARGSLRVNDVPMSAGDGLMLRDASAVVLEGGAAAEVLVFDLSAEAD